MENGLLLLAIFGLFFAGIVKGITGLGYSSCALPFLAPLVGLKAAVALVVIPALISNLQVVLTTRHLSETLVRFRWLYSASLPGIAVGLAVLSLIEQASAIRLLGVVIITYALIALTRPVWTVTAKLERRLQIPVGLSNGIITGLTGSQVIPLFPYMMALDLDSERLVQAINVAVTLASMALAVGLVMVGIISIETAPYSILAIVPAILGVGIGTQVRRHLPQTDFRRIVLAVLLAMGGMLVR